MALLILTFSVYFIVMSLLFQKEQIAAEYKARVLNCHPDKHPNDPEKGNLLQIAQIVSW